MVAAGRVYSTVSRSGEVFDEEESWVRWSRFLHIILDGCDALEFLQRLELIRGAHCDEHIAMERRNGPISGRSHFPVLQPSQPIRCSPPVGFLP